MVRCCFGILCVCTTCNNNNISWQLHRLAEMIWLMYVVTTDTLFLQEYLLFIARNLLRAPDTVCKTRQEGKTIY